MARSRTSSPRRSRGRGPARSTAFLRVGSWIGGDRDGNPFVTARRAERGDAAAERARARPLSRGAARARRRIVAERARWSRVTRDARARSPSAPPTRRRRGATSPIAAPSPASIRASPRPRAELDHFVALRQPLIDAPRLRSAGELRRRSRDRSPTRSRRTARGFWRAAGCATLRRAVDVFGFHLAPLDLRQNSDVHERTVAELFAAASLASTICSLDEEARVALLRTRAAFAAPARLAVPRL